MQGLQIAAIVAILASTPLLETDDRIDRGATVVYTVSIVEGVDYWVVLSCIDPGSDLDLVVASREMDFDHFMSLPYYEDFLYCRDFALATGVSRGSEDITLSAPYTGVAYIVIHDMGETGGAYQLRIL